VLETIRETDKLNGWTKFVLTVFQGCDLIIAMTAYYARSLKKTCIYNPRLFCKNRNLCPFDDDEFTDIIEEYIFNPRLFSAGSFKEMLKTKGNNSENSLIWLAETSRWFKDFTILEGYQVYSNTGKLKISRKICAEWQHAYLGFCEYKIKKLNPTRTQYDATEEARGFCKRRAKIEKLLKPVPPMVRLCMSVSSGMHRSLKEGKGGRHWECLVGYTKHQLKKHLESLFQKGMAWDNCGLWHLDHIIPIMAFNFTKAIHPDFRKCWDLSNLQPLWKHDNL